METRKVNSQNPRHRPKSQSMSLLKKQTGSKSASSSFLSFLFYSGLQGVGKYSNANFTEKPPHKHTQKLCLNWALLGPVKSTHRMNQLSHQWGATHFTFQVTKVFTLVHREPWGGRNPQFLSSRIMGLQFLRNMFCLRNMRNRVLISCLIMISGKTAVPINSLVTGCFSRHA